MVEKSQEQFRKDILEILKKNGDEIKEFKKEVRKEMTNKQPEKQIIDKNSGYSYMTLATISTKIILSEGERQAATQAVGTEMKTIMKKYKLSKLECFVVRDYV